MEMKQLSAADYEEIFALSQFAFQYELSEAAFAAKEAEAKRHIIWGMMNDGRLAAKMHLIPLSCYIHGRKFEVGGVSSVATWPEYRRQGLVKKLLYHGLKQMKQDRVSIFLHQPYSVSFYLKYRRELTNTEKHYTIPVEKMRGSWDASVYVRRTQRDIPLLDQIYTEYAKNFTGMTLRDE